MTAQEQRFAVLQRFNAEMFQQAMTQLALHGRFDPALAWLQGAVFALEYPVLAAQLRIDVREQLEWNDPAIMTKAADQIAGALKEAEAT